MLHGTIDINEHVIAEWTAENTLETFMGDAVYLCKVKYTDNAGYKHEFEFVMTHEPEHGALRLAWGILQKAANEVRIAKIRSEENSGQKTCRD